MSIKKSVCSKLIKNFQLRDLFNQLGWDHTTRLESVAISSPVCHSRGSNRESTPLKSGSPIESFGDDTSLEQVFQLEAIAKKSAFFVFVCETNGKVPVYAIRKKMDSVITKLYHQHLIIYIDSTKRQQVWQLVMKELDKPAIVRETIYYSTQEPELLFQKLQHLFFSIDEEDNITVVDVTDRVRTGFNNNAEKVTKKFYEGFKKEHTAFLAFINGISESQDQDWYASLMLNRLMFIYFIQKKGFLNNDKFYLKTKLAETQSHKGKDKFYSFYRNFLLLLFHQGLGSPDHSNVEIEIGKVPYLNGGLFDVHELETKYSGIQIEDTAFERIFDFFDQYEWHLDTRQQATGKEINPDVIGYIFEKYINDRAAMGAYYTKEDITDYIGKNCIIPFLFDELKRHYPTALKPGGEVWSLLKNHADDYIYDAVKHGTANPPQPPFEKVGSENHHQSKTVSLESPPSIKGDLGGFAVKPLPAEIAKGLDDVSQRGEWNKTAPVEYALPTEIWREVVERRRRYTEVKGKIESGDIHEINDLITYNLNITKFAIDVIQNSTDPELIRHFYKALEKITVLDPTCGSGAFLFAAMNILEPLYEACIERMRAFVEESASGARHASPLQFDKILARVDATEHPNLQYFIFKSIILNNLFGVDIMKEAIEIAKLRLFLKLVATVDVDYKKPNMGLEPLPDIDFNIRSGNTLVGFVSIEEVKKSVAGSFDAIYMDKEIASIEEAADYVKRAYDSFREVQIAGDATVKEFKKILTEKLAKLNDKLDGYLVGVYGKAVKNAAEYKAWHESHKPFHWFAEFYEIIHDRGGFDVIIGNPPYVEYSKARKEYSIKGYETESCGNLYAHVTERSFNLLSTRGCFGLIVPISVVCTQRMQNVQDVLSLKTNCLWLSTYAERPSKLFMGAEVLLAILIANNNNPSKSVFSTGFTKWASIERELLFAKTTYNKLETKFKPYVFQKTANYIEQFIISTVMKEKYRLTYYIKKATQHKIYYRIGGGRYWKIFTDFQPQFILNGSQSVSSRENYIYAESNIFQQSIIALLSSSLFYWYFILTTNCRDLNPSDLHEFPIDFSNMDKKLLEKLKELADQLMEDYKSNSKLKDKKSSQTGSIVYQEFYPKLSKPIIDKIDTILAKHYGFTDEELDFIINYDIKYRMGKGAGEEDGDE
jgi:tRNA1(Val) A37 N6-methylase TrmN6